MLQSGYLLIEPLDGLFVLRLVLLQFILLNLLHLLLLLGMICDFPLDCLAFDNHRISLYSEVLVDGCLLSDLCLMLQLLTLENLLVLINLLSCIFVAF